MQRTSLALDPKLLEEARRDFGAKIYSATGNRVLAGVIRLHRTQGLCQLSGSGIWKGNLAEMREGRSAPRREARPAAQPTGGAAG